MARSFASPHSHDFKERVLDTDTPRWTGTLSKSHAIQLTLKGLSVHDVVSWEGQETLSQPFHFRVWVRLEPQKPVPEKLIGKAASFTFLSEDKKPLRCFHGLVSRVSDGGILEKDCPLVALDIHPTWWFLAFTQACRIFSEMKTIDIIKQVLHENDVTFDDKTSSAGKEKREFCVQYRESHYAFVSRLMEEEGIFYFFVHAADRHTLVLMDDNKSCASLGTIPFLDASSGGALFQDRLYRMRRTQESVPNYIELNDYNFKKPDDNMYISIGKKEALSLSVYTYPGVFDERTRGESLSKKRLEAEECLTVLFEGVSSHLQFSPGKTFQLTGYRDESFDKTYLLLGVHHRYGLDEKGAWHFSNTFQAIPAKTSFKPREITPKPLAYQDTAIVMGRKGDEIYTNEEGHIKVKFHWDTRASSKVKDEERSCWIRVASGWAGSGWGMIHTPRVGQEVVVAFLNHNPDRPLVVGSVYNGTHKPPYVDKDKTQAGIRSHTTEKGKDENYNEIRLTDEKEKEEFFIQAEKDFKGVVKDSMDLTLQKGSMTTTIDRGDRKVTLKGEKDPTNGKGDDFLTLEKGSRTIELKGKDGNIRTIIADGNQVLEIKKGNKETTISSGDDVMSLKNGKQEVTIKGGGYTLKITGGDVTIETTGKLKVNAKAGISFSTLGEMTVDCMKFSLNAKTTAALAANVQLTLEGKAQSSLKGAMVDVAGQAMTKVSGAMVMVN